MRRRKFLELTASMAGVVPVINACKGKRSIPGSVTGASANIGHLLRDKDFSLLPEPEERTDVVIVGGGVSGLTAAWWLKKQGLDNFVVLDLETAMGGNSAGGYNEVSAYPRGAHYIPLPNNDLTEYLLFLEESNVITGRDMNGLPVYNELYLCFDPQERLYINGMWQDGLVPQYGVPEKDTRQIKAFLQRMEELRRAKGKDGKDAFAIPVDRSSSDEEYTRLDSITMKEWLRQQGWDSEYLYWYVNYSTRDDFGSPAHIVSAWAGIHYFAARKGAGSNAQHNDVLTWPEGNAFLVNSLSRSCKENWLNNSLAVKVKDGKDHAEVSYVNTKNGKIQTLRCRQVVVATPEFITARLIDDMQRANLVHSGFSYCPWVVANLKVSELIERQGRPLSWDNVIYGNRSLGYVNATQQLLQQKTPYKNITYYLPLTDGPTVSARKAAHGKTHAQWLREIFNDLVIVHPNIEEATLHADITVWGHAMVQPLPGIAHGPLRKQLQQSKSKHIHFAHTDLAGISIFEEGFYQGLAAARKVLRQLA